MKVHLCHRCKHYLTGAGNSPCRTCYSMWAGYHRKLTDNYEVKE